MTASDQLRAAVTLVVAGGIGLLAACALPVEDKTGCFDSNDCNGARACVSNACEDDACRLICGYIQGVVGVCPGLSDPTDPRFASDCRGLQGFLRGLNTGACKSIWDRIEMAIDPGDACDVPLCATQCEQICGQADACALITDFNECKAGCIAQRPSCAESVAVTSCSDVPSEVLCYEARRLDAC